jgi:cytochrome c553
MRETYSRFYARKFEAETKARQREQRTGRDFDLTREPAEGEWSFLDMRRPYCADCHKVKGSKAKNRYFPKLSCSNCGSTKTRLRDFDENEISWD